MHRLESQGDAAGRCLGGERGGAQHLRLVRVDAVADAELADDAGPERAVGVRSEEADAGGAGGAAMTDAARKVALAMKAAMTVVRDAFMGDGSCERRALAGTSRLRNARRCRLIADFGE